MAHPKKIWLIDDDEDDSFLFEAALSNLEENVEFSAEQNGEMALVKLSSGVDPMPDILFLDWNMPRVTGMDCLKAIRKLPAFNSVPIIIYTTAKAIPDQREAILLGASFFLTKPNSIEDLTRQLKHLLSMDWSKQEE